MKVFLKGLNSCVMRRGKLKQYALWLTASGHDIVAHPAQAEHIIVWSCGFRGDVRDNCIASIQQMEKDNPQAVVITAGCLPDIDPDLLRQKLHGPFVSWKNDAAELSQLFGGAKQALQGIPEFVEERICANAAEFRRQKPSANVQFHDEFIKLLVSEGCGHKCSYCSERLTFPRFRSFPPELLLKRACDFTKDVIQPRIVLVADSLGEYGSDIGTSLPQLIRQLVFEIPGLCLALNNLNPADFVRFFSDFAGLIEEKIICHINLPIQSASDEVLQRMCREYSKLDLSRVFGMFNEKNFTRFDTHVIIGFPGESEDDYRETERFILLHRPAYVLASRYMEAPKMPAASMENHCDDSVVLDRVSRFFKSISAAGIICNVESGSVMQDRLERINNDSSAEVR